MAKDSPTRQPSKVLGDIYIYIGGYGNVGGNTHFNLTQYEGDGHVKVYKSLDAGHGIPRVEHVVKVGEFYLHNVKQKSVDEFLRDIRQGIEKLVGTEVEP